MTTIRKPAKHLALGSALVAALALPLALAAPAQAATTSGGCTVRPLTPVFAGFNSSGVKLINYRVRITCDAARTVSVQQRRYEDDTAPDADDLIGRTSFSRSFDEARTITVSVRRSMPDTENGNEELYQTVRFRVTSNGVTSSWTQRERSGVVSVPN